MDIKKLLTEENVGGLDLMIRALAGTLALIALTGLYTAIMRHCTPYVLLGISTKKGD